MKKDLKNQSEIKTKGVHTFEFFDCSSLEAKKLENKITELSSLKKFCKTEKENRDHWNEYRNLINQFNDKFLKNKIVVENITTTVGRSVLAQRLSGTTTYTGTVNYTALGTDNTAPTVSDTTLGTETYRKLLGSGTFSNNIAYLETFFTASEVTGTFEEYGMFIDGTASADTGQLFNRFTTTVAKSGNETLNVQSIINLNDN